MFLPLNIDFCSHSSLRQEKLLNGSETPSGFLTRGIFSVARSPVMHPLTFDSFSASHIRGLRALYVYVVSEIVKYVCTSIFISAGFQAPSESENPTPNNTCLRYNFSNPRTKGIYLDDAMFSDPTTYAPNF